MLTHQALVTQTTKGY